MKTLRCAIYTRKSSEEGLDQGFNSLHAQREACEAYVLSQAGEGWRALKQAYDDGGFSGGSMDRPGLKALLADIAARRIDVVVVYKVDRLTRSLMDFAKIVEMFDQHTVSFVSVTQAFNTTSSMGRLTLNVLLSFAQFEREVTGERIREKLAASKRKGMWMGGVPPLGYDKPTDLLTRALVVNEAEAETVRLIFRTYVEVRSVYVLRNWLTEQGIKSKAWITRRGRPMGGLDFLPGAIFHLLRNRTYLGETPHKDQSYPGAHPPIVDAALFDQAQAILDQNMRHRPGGGGRVTTPSLRRLVFDADGAPMTPSHTCGPNGRLYRYYVSAALQKGSARDSEDSDLQRVSASLLEGLIHDVLEQVVGRPVENVRDFLRRVEVRGDAILLSITRVGIFRREPEADRELQILRGRLRDIQDAKVELLDDLKNSRENPDSQDRGFSEENPDDQYSGFLLKIPCHLKRSGGRTWITDEDGRAVRRTAKPDRALIKALRASHQLIADGKSRIGFPEMATIEAAPPSGYDRLICRLAFLSPEIQQLILESCQPVELTLASLMAQEIPLLWSDQQARFLP